MTGWEIKIVGRSQISSMAFIALPSSGKTTRKRGRVIRRHSTYAQSREVKVNIGTRRTVGVFGVPGGTRNVRIARGEMGECVGTWLKAKGIPSQGRGKRLLGGEASGRDKA